MPLKFFVLFHCWKEGCCSTAFKRWGFGENAMNLKYSCYALKRSACYMFELQPETAELNDEKWAERVKGCHEDSNVMIHNGQTCSSKLMMSWLCELYILVQLWGTAWASKIYEKEKWNRKKVEWRLMVDNSKNTSMKTHIKPLKIAEGHSLSLMVWSLVTYPDSAGGDTLGCYLQWLPVWFYSPVPSGLLWMPAMENHNTGKFQCRAQGSVADNYKPLTDVLHWQTDENGRITEAETIELRDSCE